MSNNPDDLMGPWGNVTPSFWATPSDPDPVMTQDSTITASGTTSLQPGADVSPAAPVAAAQAPPGPPAEYGPRIAAVFTAIQRQADPARVEAARVDAERLDWEITARFGEVHSHTVSIREVRGWLALNTGQPVDATRWYLHTLDLQRQVWGPGHAFTRASAEQAVYAWTSISDRGEARRLGVKLLPMLHHSVGEQDKLTRHVSRRLMKLHSGA